MCVIMATQAAEMVQVQQTIARLEGLVDVGVWILGVAGAICSGVLGALLILYLQDRNRNNKVHDDLREAITSAKDDVGKVKTEVGEVKGDVKSLSTKLEGVPETVNLLVEEMKQDAKRKREVATEAGEKR